MTHELGHIRGHRGKIAEDCIGVQNESARASRAELTSVSGKVSIVHAVTSENVSGEEHKHKGRIAMYLMLSRMKRHFINQSYLCVGCLISWFSLY